MKGIIVSSCCIVPTWTVYQPTRTYIQHNALCNDSGLFVMPSAHLRQYLENIYRSLAQSYPGNPQSQSAPLLSLSSPLYPQRCDPLSAIHYTCLSEERPANFPRDAYSLQNASPAGRCRPSAYRRGALDRRPLSRLYTTCVAFHARPLTARAADKWVTMATEAWPWPARTPGRRRRPEPLQDECSGE